MVIISRAFRQSRVFSYPQLYNMRCQENIPYLLIFEPHSFSYFTIFFLLVPRNTLENSSPSLLVISYSTKIPPNYSLFSLKAFLFFFISKFQTKISYFSFLTSSQKNARQLYNPKTTQKLISNRTSTVVIFIKK